MFEDLFWLSTNWQCYWYAVYFKAP